MVDSFAKVPVQMIAACFALLFCTFIAAVYLGRQRRRTLHNIEILSSALRSLNSIDRSERHQGLPLKKLEELRALCSQLDRIPREWWDHLDGNIDVYVSPEDHEGWFVTDRPRNLLSYELVVGGQFHFALFSAFPGLLTAAGLTLTFVAILLALFDLNWNAGNAANPITGIDNLINGLSGKFLSSITALVLGILFTFYEKNTVRKLRLRYEQLVTTISDVVPYLSSSRILLDIQRFAAQQTISVSNISSDVVDRFMGAFNSQVAPGLAAGMSSGVAEKLQSEFRTTMDRMTSTLETLQSAIIGLEGQKQETVTGEIRGLVESLDNSLVKALSKMGDDFHEALTSAAAKEFSNVAGTLDGTRQVLSDMNVQFAKMQAAFATVVEKAEQTTSDQLKTGREQTEALTLVMNGLVQRLHESADQNLNNVRGQLTAMLGDLTGKLGAVSEEMMSAVATVARQSQASANEVLEKTGNWSEATAHRLESLLSNVEARSVDFQQASQSLLNTREFLNHLITENAQALSQMAHASRNVEAYSNGLAGQSDALKTIGQQQMQVSNQLQEVSTSIRLSSEKNENLLAEYRKAFQDYRSVIDTLDVSLTRVLDAIQSGMRDYNLSVENNFREIVGISNNFIPELSGLLKTQVEGLSDGLDELASVIARTTERTNGRVKQL